MKSPKRSNFFYEIRVEGELGEMWMGWFDGLSIRNEYDEESKRHITVLYGQIPDQPALHRVLNQINDLNLTLVSIKKYE